MGSQTNLPCPQCLHPNALDALKCSLCDWSLDAKQAEETLMVDRSDIDPDQTMAPGSVAGNTDPNLTIAPDILAQSQVSAGEKHTFHLAGDLAHFEILEILGQGGMGAVYHATDRTLQRDVALKMLRPIAASNRNNTDVLLDEARMASKLNHPNIVTIYDVARAENSNYIVMEWVDGQPLDELIPNDGLPLEQAMVYACQIAAGLSSAHQKYIIHRDIKPQNIMLSSDNSIKILDFGIAGLVSQVSDINQTSTSNLITGTPSYMSPEQSQGLNLDQRSDIFSFGVVLYQMLSGQRPFSSQDLTALNQAISAGDYTPIQQHVPDLPAEVIKVIDKMLAPQRDQRWQSSAELATALQQIHDELTHQKNWWQRRHWLSKVAMMLPFVLALGWSAKEIFFPASTQQLIERQLAEANKIAILPFDNISGDPLLQIFGDGLAVNLGSDLAAIASQQGNTWIVPATEISRMKDQSPKKVTDKYGVNLILTGSLQHLGSTRLLVLNLLNASSGQQMKTTEVSIEANELFQGHDMIRAEALSLLGWNIPDTLAAQFRAQRPQLDGAYKDYVQGRGYLYRFDQTGNADKALTAFSAAIEADKYYENAYVGLAEVQLRKFHETGTVDWLEQMDKTINDLAKINPNNSQINFLSAELAMKKGDYQQAVKLYQASVEQTPKHALSHIGLAKAHHETGNSDVAESIYQTISQAEPNNWRVVSGFGIFYFQMGNYQGALRQFKRLSEMSPNNDLGVRNMAAAYYALGDINNAIIYTRLAIKLNPSDRAYSNLGTMLFYDKRYLESIDAFQQAVGLREGYYVHWGNLADAYRLTDDDRRLDAYRQAADLALSALKLNPNDTSVMADVAYYLANTDDKQLALSYAQRIEADDSGTENFMVATAYDALNDADMALKHLSYAINKNYPIEEILNTPLLATSRKDQRFDLLTTVE